jgi:alcohol dehydrogenase (cytochrome c)
MTACGSSVKATTRFSGPAPTASASWLYPNGDLANTRDAVGSTISSANVADLKEAWTFKLSGTAAAGVSGIGSLTANPIVQNGLVYLQDLDCNVYAVALATGRLKWEYKVDTPERSGPGPNGVAVAGGVVYAATPTSVFALRASTGQKIWANSHLLNKGQGTFGIQPQVVDGRVYLASQYGSGPGGGVLLGLSAATGKVLWRFNTVTGPEPGVKALGLGAGGAWETPLVRPDGTVTYGIANPYQSPGSAIAEPAKMLYTNSVVNLSAATGKLRWYYQAVPDDFKDYDMQVSPIAARIDGAPAVLGGGKMGDVYAMNAKTGRLIWKTPVGEHNGHDDDSLQALEGRSTLKTPYTFMPGSVGGVLTNMALAGNTVYVVTCDYAFAFSSMKQIDGLPAKGASPTGQVEALNLATGKVEWNTKVASLPLGAATVSNNLVFTTLLTGVLIALNRTTGAIVYQHRLPATANSPIAVAGNTVLVPAGHPGSAKAKGTAQLLAYTVP